MADDGLKQLSEDTQGIFMKGLLQKFLCHLKHNELLLLYVEFTGCLWAEEWEGWQPREYIPEPFLLQMGWEYWTWWYGLYNYSYLLLVTGRGASWLEGSEIYSAENVLNLSWVT